MAIWLGQVVWGIAPRRASTPALRPNNRDYSYRSMGLTRRAFFGRSGLVLGMLGISQAGLALLADRFAEVFAAPAPRRFALLVGINQYPEAVCDYAIAKSSALNGCLTDVELQRELLIHRFGFNPADILTLTNQAATRSAIETAFQAHLLDQARAGDSVLFHFSGLGSQVRLSAGEASALENHPDVLYPSLVPIDGRLPTETDPLIQDVMLETLDLLVRSLPTQRIMTVLDLGFWGTGSPLLGALRVRSRPNIPTGQLLPAEQELQEVLRNRLQGRSVAVEPPGVRIVAASSERPALEGQWGSFSAGLLTHALTQRLWEALPPKTIQVVFRQVQQDLQRWVGDRQQAVLNDTTPTSATVTSLLGGSRQAVASDAAIASLNSDASQAQVWLGGLPASIADNLYSGALLAVDASAQKDLVPTLLEIRSRDGLRAIAVPFGNPAVAQPLQVGQLLQEWVRLIPRNVGLTIALDSQLERIERVDATSAFAATKVAVVVAGEQAADYVFGKQLGRLPAVATAIAPDTAPQPSSDVPLRKDVAPLKQSYGLYLPGKTAIPTTLGDAGEAVKTAVNRLVPSVRSLQATKLLRLTENSFSSRLGVRAELLQFTGLKQQSVWQQHTSRAPYPLPGAEARGVVASEGMQQALAGSALQFRVTNYSDQSLQFVALGCDRQGRFTLLIPEGMTQEDSAPRPLQLSAGSSQTLPTWLPADAGGFVETYLIFSCAPLTQTLAALSSNRPNTTPASSIALKNALEVVQAILQDLNDASSVEIGASDAYALDVNQWASLCCAYQV